MEPDPEGEYYLGIDFCKHEDETVVVITRKLVEDGVEHYYMVAMESWQDLRYDDVMAEVEEGFFQLYEPAGSLGDKQGVGEAVS